MKTYTIVASDIHGDLNQLLQPLMLFLSDPAKYTLIYLGDYIDRGESSVYIYEILSRLVIHPKIHVLWGNHEINDHGIQDYISYRSKYRKRGMSYLKTFMFELFTNLNLDVVYYDKNTNILYSHGPLNRPLAKALQLTKSIESTYTYDINSKTMEYKNIHGHDHRRTQMDMLKKFFNGKEFNMISIDNDASYGMRLEANAYTMASKNWVKDVKSHVHFLVICDQDIREFRVVNNAVPYGSDADYNTKPFPEIKRALVNGSVDQRMRDMFGRMTLDISYAHFRRCLGNVDVGELPRVIRERYENIIRNHCEDGGANVYFQDVPFEFYQRAMAEAKNPSDRLKSIVAGGYRPVYDIYWNHVVGGHEKFDANVGGSVDVIEGMLGGADLGNQWFGIVLVVIMVSVVGVVIFVVYRSKVLVGGAERYMLS